MTYNTLQFILPILTTIYLLWIATIFESTDTMLVVIFRAIPYMLAFSLVLMAFKIV